MTVRKCRHWKMPDAERTLCGRVVKPREVDMEWPLCKRCDQLSEFYPTTVTFTDEQIREMEEAPVPEGQEGWPRVTLTSFTVQRIRAPKHRRKVKS